MESPVAIAKIPSYVDVLVGWELVSDRTSRFITKIPEKAIHYQKVVGSVMSCCITPY